MPEKLAALIKSSTVLCEGPSFVAMHPSVSITVGTPILNASGLGLRYPSQQQVRPAIKNYIDVKLGFRLSQETWNSWIEMQLKLANKKRIPTKQTAAFDALTR